MLPPILLTAAILCLLVFGPPVRAEETERTPTLEVLEPGAPATLEPLGLPEDPPAEPPLPPAEDSVLSDTDPAPDPMVSVSGGPAARAVEEGFAALSDGRPGEALAAYQRALDLDPDQPDAHLGAGAAFQALGRQREAADAFDRALGLRPGDALARARLVEALGQLAPELALERLGRLSADFPGDGAITTQIGLLLLRQNNALGAVGALEHAAALAPDDGAAHLNLAIAADRAGQPDKAVAAYRRAITLFRAAEAPPGVDLAALARRARWLEISLEEQTP